MSEAIISLDENNFKEIVMNNGGWVLVEFGTPDCKPCQLIDPEIENIALKLKGTLTVGRVNLHKCKNLGKEYEIRYLPTFYLFKDGVVVRRMRGALLDRIKLMLESSINGINLS